MAYNSTNTNFPYDPEEMLVDDSGEECSFVAYYRFQGADICKTTLATAHAMGTVIAMKKEGLAAEPTELPHGVKQKDGKKDGKKSRRRSVSGKALEEQQLAVPADDADKKDKTDSWVQARVTLKNYLNGPAHRSLMLILTIVSYCCCCFFLSLLSYFVELA